MTGTTDLSIDQFEAIAAKLADKDSNTVRLVIHPRPNQAVKVETHSLSYGDVLAGHFYVLRDGTRLTRVEYVERFGNDN